MQEIKLTPRLKKITQLIPAGAAIADVGTDHGYLPLWLLKYGKVRSAIASDIRKGPLARAQENAVRYHLQNKISIRLSPGLEAVSPKECDTVIIAGMGGETMMQILSNASWTLAGRHKIILQPMTRIAELRQFLWHKGYCIEQEHICLEDQRYYIILYVTGGGTPDSKLPLAKCCISPALLKAPDAKTYLTKLLQRELRVLDGMEQARTTSDLYQIQHQRVQTLMQAMEELK